MPITVGKASADDLKVWRRDFGEDGDLNVTFDISGLTPAVEAQLRSAMRSPDDADPMVMARFLAQIIDSWDLLGADGDPVPLTADAIGDLPYSILTVVWEGIQEVSKPGEQNGGT